jgi:hypothetical protein
VPVRRKLGCGWLPRQLEVPPEASTAVLYCLRSSATRRLVLRRCRSSFPCWLLVMVGAEGRSICLLES